MNNSIDLVVETFKLKTLLAAALVYADEGNEDDAQTTLDGVTVLLEEAKASANRIYNLI